MSNIFPVEVTAVGDEGFSEGSESGNDIPFVVAPNPCNPVTFLTFVLRREGRVSLKIYSTRGRLVDAVLENTILPSGLHRIKWTPKGLATGVYFAKLSVPSGSGVRKVVILR